MPIREYKCKDCDHKFEAIILDNEKPLCDECSSDNLVALVSAHGFYSIKGNNSASVTPKKFRGES